MEILNRLWEIQDALEDVLRLESTPEEIKETKEGRDLFRYLRRRRRVVNHITRILKKI